MTHFTLVHGAWHGAWCWERTAAVLSAEGHTVVALTQTGLGEKAHLLTGDITLSTFVDDAVRFLEDQDIRDTVLVGHSFGGNTITGAAARLPGRIRELVYLDAMIPESGVAPLSTVPKEVADARRKAAMDFSGGVSIPCPPASAFGLADPALQRFVEARLTPHPLGAYDTAINFDGPPGNGVPARYIQVTDPPYSNLALHLERARGLGWPIQTIAACHDCMIDAPEALARLLIDGTIR